MYVDFYVKYWLFLLDFNENLIFSADFRKILKHKGTAVAQWLRRCATIRKVAGSIPAGFSGFSIDIKSF